MTLEFILLLALPMIPSFWGIHHAFFHNFPTAQERLLWLCLCVFVPVLGGIIYFFIARKRTTGKLQF